MTSGCKQLQMIIINRDVACFVLCDLFSRPRTTTSKELKKPRKLQKRNSLYFPLERFLLYNQWDEKEKFSFQRTHTQPIVL